MPSQAEDRDQPNESAPVRRRYTQPGGNLTVMQQAKMYQQYAAELREMIRQREAYWAEHHGQPTFDRTTYNNLHARCVLTHVARDDAAFAAGIDPYALA